MTLSSSPLPMDLPCVTLSSHLTLHYRLSLKGDGLGSNQEVMSTFDSKPATLQMGMGQLAEPLERLLIGMAEGQEKSFDLDASQAFGPRNPEMIQALSRATLDSNSAAGSIIGNDGQAKEDFEVGDLLEFPRPDGGRYAGVLKELNEKYALIDFNHPLAGQAVRFEVKLLGVL
jgi:FKBP-type peptidyl-prolyl cis-trans isomerase SlpA